jgi:hypothetical protein
MEMPGPLASSARSVTTRRWILRSRSIWMATARGVSGATLTAGEVMRWRASMPRQWDRYASTKVELARSVREITPTASPAASVTTSALTCSACIVRATSVAGVSGRQATTPVCIQSRTSVQLTVGAPP